MEGAEERRLRHISHTSQGGATEGNAADGALLVDQGWPAQLTGIRSRTGHVGAVTVLNSGSRPIPGSSINVSIRPISANSEMVSPRIAKYDTVV
jgi:hypothetical protein